MSVAHTHFQIDPDIIYTPLDDREGVLLHLKTQRYYSLNETGSLIWQHLQKNKSLAEISQTLREIYEVENPSDFAREFVADLRNEGLVKQISKEKE